jgi:hypothetical protein
MKVTVFRYGRYNGQTDNVTPVAGKWATRERIEELDHEPIGRGIEVDVSDVVDGWWVGNSVK